MVAYGRWLLKEVLLLLTTTFQESFDNADSHRIERQFILIYIIGQLEVVQLLRTRRKARRMSLSFVASSRFRNQGTFACKIRNPWNLTLGFRNLANDWNL